jgi:hypothetical protein
VDYVEGVNENAPNSKERAANNHGKMPRGFLVLFFVFFSKIYKILFPPPKWKFSHLCLP